MKRIAIVIAAIAATLLVAAPAQADPKKDCVPVAALPDSCVDQATADYIAELKADFVQVLAEENRWRLEVSNLRPQVALLTIERTQLQTALTNAENLLTNAEWRADKWQRIAQRRALIIVALRAKVKALQTRG